MPEDLKVTVEEPALNVPEVSFQLPATLMVEALRLKVPPLILTSLVTVTL